MGEEQARQTHIAKEKEREERSEKKRKRKVKMFTENV